MKAWYVIFAFALSLFSVTTAWAQTAAPAQSAAPRYGRGAGPGLGQLGPGPAFWEALNLDAAQQNQFVTMRAKFLEKYAADSALLATKLTEMEALWRAPEPNRKAILAKDAEIDTLGQKLQDGRVDFALAMNKILSPEQRSKALDLFFRHGFANHEAAQDCCGCGNQAKP